ncbi:MAG: TonB family protein [Chitinispirillia bacterium]|nr:TonB family protein [Chitinispirillia bacterium]MCL2241238.1 TonB family protein [Chitinispirillia bacterium]
MRLRHVAAILALILAAAAAEARPNRAQVRNIILHQIKSVSMLSSTPAADSSYWLLALQGLEIVPVLIDLADDTTETGIMYPPNPAIYSVGDVAVSILHEIIYGIYMHPIADIIKKSGYQCDDISSPWMHYFDFVRSGVKNRVYLKKELGKWYAENKANLVWVTHELIYEYSGGYYPTRGHYRLKGPDIAPGSIGPYSRAADSLIKVGRREAFAAADLYGRQIFDLLARARENAAFDPNSARSRESIHRGINRNMPGMRKAYAAHRHLKPGFEGTVAVKFSINEHGRVTSAQIVSSTMNDPQFDRYVFNEVLNFKFDEIDKPGDVAEIIYPFSFWE